MDARDRMRGAIWGQFVGDAACVAILATLRAGGDSAGRASMVGAWLGAALGAAAIPPEWVGRLAARAVVHADVERVIGRRSAESPMSRRLAPRGAG